LRCGSASTPTVTFTSPGFTAGAVRDIIPGWDNRGDVVQVIMGHGEITHSNRYSNYTYRRAQLNKKAEKNPALV
jgi:hypothetical protein